MLLMGNSKSLKVFFLWIHNSHKPHECVTQALSVQADHHKKIILLCFIFMVHPIFKLSLNFCLKYTTIHFCGFDGSVCGMNVSING